MITTKGTTRERERERESTKESILSNLQDKVNLGVLEPENFKLLQKLITNASNIDEALQIEQMGIAYKKTGFYYQVKLDKVNDNKIHYLKKNVKLSFDQGGVHHKLIIGDNYHALKNLLITHSGKIDVIYIDPPYGANGMGEYASTNFVNQITRDNLLSMLKPRLMLARDLLSSNGIIYCSIDDKNQAYLKCLFDEIFGENNFLANFTRKTADSHSGEGEKISNKCDYVLMYGKNGGDMIQSIRTNYDFDFKDKNGKYKLTSLLAKGNHSTNIERPNCFYPIYVSKDLKSISLKKIDGYYEIYPPQKKGKTNVFGRWNWGKNWDITEINDGIINANDFGKTNINLIVAKREDGNINIYRKHYEADVSNGKKIYKSICYGNLIDQFKNADGSRELTNIFGKKVFTFPKPVELIKYLLNIVNFKNAIILDFFAGSGTTGQAVLELNKEDGGNRQFILSTLDENIDELLKTAKKEEIETLQNAKDVLKQLNLKNDLSMIAYERLYRIMSGKASDNKTKFKWSNNNKKTGGSLDVVGVFEINNNNEQAFKDINPLDYDVNDKDSLKTKLNGSQKILKFAKRH